MPYEYQEFPKWKYHPDREPIMVDDAQQETDLGPDWFDRPDQAREALARLREALLKKKAV
jgi:hypothetical protein